MNELDVGVALEVMKERQRVLESHLKDVDECCGKLKGLASQEHRMLGEEISAIKQDMKHACSGVETDVEVLRAYFKQQKECIEDCQEEITDMLRTQRKFYLGLISSFLLALVTLFINVS